MFLMDLIFKKITYKNLQKILILFLLPQVLFARNICEKAFELSTHENQIVDQCGNHFKLKSVNWFGAHEATEVTGGLNKQPMAKIVKLIKDAGFNSVRLTYSNQMLHDNNIVDPKLVSANPELQNLTPLEIFDRVIKALTDAGIVVVLNNHTTTSQWCCGFDFNGMWHHPHFQSTASWIDDWLMLVKRYLDNPYVAAVDLRNEVRTGKYHGTIIPVFPNWGLKDENDWKLAATHAANAIHDINPKLLVVVEGINWYGVPMINGYRPMLEKVKKDPIILNAANKLVYEEHVYGFTGPKHTGDDKMSPGQTHYRDMNEQTFKNTLDAEFGYILEPGHNYTAPVWLGEFGTQHSNPSEKEIKWFENMVNYLIDKDMSWGFWALNPERSDGSVEPFGLLTDDWSAFRDDWRQPYIQQLLQS